VERQKTFQEKRPTLYLVATPIGNLGDFTHRAIATLNDVDIILAEDTRTSGVLLKHYDITTALKSYHAHNENARLESVIRYLGEGKDIALISDAGTPLLSDPGESLVRAVRKSGYLVTSIPGPSALLSALVVTDILTHPFTFIGFLPAKEKARKDILKTYKSLTHTLVFYESPHRLKATLATMYEVFGARKTAVAREMTKLHEEIIHFDLSNHPSFPEVKGEIVLIVEGSETDVVFDESDMVEHVELLIDDGLKEMDAIKSVAKQRGLKKNKVYMAYQKHKQQYKDSEE